MEESTTGLLQYASEAEGRRSSEFSKSFSTNSTRTVLVHMPKEISRKRLNMNSRRHIYLAVTTLFLVIFSGIILLNSTAGRTKSTSATWKHCRSSPKEARQNDCVYDFIAGAFVPRAYFDAELEEEFLNLKDWRFYGDSNAEQELSIESIKMDGGTELLFVSVEIIGYTARIHGGNCIGDGCLGRRLMIILQTTSIQFIAGRGLYLSVM